MDLRDDDRQLALPPDVRGSAPRPRRGSLITRRRLARLAVMVAVTALAVVVMALPWSPAAARGDGAPTMPDGFAGHSILTASVDGNPPGRAIAAYTYGNAETFSDYQSLVVGADRDSYRRIDGLTRRYTRPGGFVQVLLAPDGSRLLAAKKGGMLLVDLRDASRRSYRSVAAEGADTDAEPRLLAWSRDGRRVAYLPGAVDPDGVPTAGRLAMLDLQTGASAMIAELSGVAEAAFAPDGLRLALEIGAEVVLVDLQGARVGGVPLPAGYHLVAHAAWSPDGALIAVSSPPDRSKPAAIMFLSSSGGPVPAPVARPEGDDDRMLGWTGPDRLLTLTPGEDVFIGRRVEEVSLANGSRRVVGGFSTGQDCEYGMQQCQAHDVQLATGLLPNLTARVAGSPDRGPWPVWVRLPLALGLESIALISWTLVRRRRRQAAGKPRAA